MARFLSSPEQLEVRNLNAALVDPIFAPGTPSSVVDAYATVSAYSTSERWSSTAVSGGNLKQGDPTVITWSIVRDGSPIPGSIGEGDSSSDFVRAMGAIYGESTPDANFQDEPWFRLVESVFTRWSTVSGVTYRYEPADDGLPINSGFSGVVGVRGDVRIGGHFIDGNSGVLAYNSFPDEGDMVIDTADSFFRNLSGDSLALRNVISHEAGHGLGLEHVYPLTQTKLMEPYASLAFDGPQAHEILAVNRLYGGDEEPNDRRLSATNLGTIVVAPTTLIGLSIDGTSDADYLRLALDRPMTVNLTATPTGNAYFVGNSRNTTTLFDAKAQNNLTIRLEDSAGNEIARRDAAGLGAPENLAGIPLGAGVYFVRMNGTNDRAQMYSLSVSGVPISQTTPAISLANRFEFAVDVNFSGVNVQTAQQIELEITRASGSVSRLMVPATALATRVRDLESFEPVSLRARTIGYGVASGWSVSISLPARPVVTIDNVFATAIDVRWTASRNAVSYEVVVRRAGQIAQRILVAAETTKYRVINLARETDYSIEVVAVGQGPSNQVTSLTKLIRTKR